MTTVLNVFPSEVYTYQMVTQLSGWDTRNLSLVSKDGLKIVEEATKVPYSDDTLEGVDHNANFEGNVTAFLHYKIRNAFLKKYPEVHARVGEIATLVREQGKELEIQNFVQYTEQYTDLNLFVALIPFDFTTKRIKAAGERGICRALYTSVWNTCTCKHSPDAIKVVLSHPAVEEIKSDEQYGWIDSLEEALKKGAHFSHEAMQTILGCPYAAVKIPAEDLEKLLKKAEGLQKPEVEKVLSDHLEKVRKLQPKKV